MRITRMMVVATMLLAAATPLLAQTEEPLKPLRGFGGGGFLVATPTGEFEDYVGTGFGLGGSFIVDLAANGIIGLRVEGGFINYGRETKRVCFSQTVGCRIEVDLTTNNNIVYGNIGPELSFPAGIFRPYFNAGIGFAYFATTSTVEDIAGGSNDDIASTTNFDDLTFAWLAGGGLRIRLSSGRTPFHLDFGARYHGNGEVEYLTEGGIIDNPDGSITLNPIRSDANLLTFSIGVTVGVRW
jgi:opacity protein-like surface antigen